MASGKLPMRLGEKSVSVIAIIPVAHESADDANGQERSYAPAENLAACLLYTSDAADEL